jgi:hypothetical protein
VKQTPKFNEGNLTWMKKEMDRQDIPQSGRHGGIVIDEMTIQDDLVITKSGDTWKLVGYVDVDDTNNNIDVICNGQKKNTTSNSCIAVYLPWIHWIQVQVYPF